MNGQNQWSSDMSSAQAIPARGYGIIGAGLMSPASAPTPLAGVPSAIAGVDAATQELASAIAGLADRLDKTGVLRPGMNSAGPNQAVPPNFACSLANEIDRHRARVQAMIAAVHELQERIDL